MTFWVLPSLNSRVTTLLRRDEPCAYAIATTRSSFANVKLTH